ncbi:MAG: ABC transporter substrate-binding protein [Eubacteriales bacterium]|nr:ABC transporter substrate-binding protein [Eubacteriales bacterium]
MKKFVAMILAVTLFLSISALAAAEPLQVSIVQLVENGAFADMREGFIARMQELGYDEDQMVFTPYDASGDMSNLYTICQNVAGEEPDAVVTIATPAAQAMVNLETDIPVFFISVSNPVGAELLTTLEAPDKNATGTSNAIPVSEMFKLSDSLTPGVTTYGLIYCASQVNSVTTINNAKAYLDENGLAYEEAVVASTAEVYEAMNALCEKDIQAIFVPNDSVIQDAMEVVTTIAKENKLPVYGSSAVMVNSGAFATISISDQEIGAITADLYKQYLDGAAIEQIPAIVVDSFTTVINQNTADAIGVTLGDEVLQSAVIVK